MAAAGEATMERTRTGRITRRWRDGVRRVAMPQELGPPPATEPPACVLDAWLRARDSGKKPPFEIVPLTRPPASPR